MYGRSKESVYAQNREREIERVKRWQEDNRATYNAHQRAWRAANHDRERAGYLKRKFGITQHHFDRLMELQRGVCAICREPPKEGQLLHVDHHGESGRIRGLLCGSCNRGIGLLKDSEDVLAQAIAYLRRGRGWRASIDAGGSL